MNYDADIAPDPARWLAASVEERKAWIRAGYPEQGRDPTLDVLATVQQVVETQLAEQRPPAAARLVKRFGEAGVPRGTAVTALITLAIGELQRPKPQQFGPDYEAKLDAMSPEQLQADMEAAEGPERTAEHPSVPHDAAYVFCAGPMEGDDGEAWMAVVLEPSETRPATFIREKNPRRALKKAAGKRRRGSLWCPPELQQFSKEFALQVGWPSDELLAHQAFTTLVLMNGEGMPPELAEQVSDLMEASVAYADAPSWLLWNPEDRIAATVTVGTTHEAWDLSLSGPGELILQAAGDLERSLREPSFESDRILSCQLEELQFGEVVKEVWGWPAVPIFHRKERSRWQPMHRRSLAVLCATLSAAAKLGEESLRVVESYGEVTVTLSAPPPSALPPSEAP